MESKKSILIIDDNGILSATLQALLKEAGHEVTCRSDGMTAIELAKDNSFQIIIADYSMPGMNGGEVVGILRKRFARSFIIGYSCEMKEKEFLQAGADVFLQKPLDYHDLESLIRNISSR